MVLVECGLMFVFLAGFAFKLFRPKKINSIYGYRSRFSMKNQSTWDEAQRYSANIFIITGSILVLLGVMQHIIFHESYLMSVIQTIELVSSVIVIYIICEYAGCHPSGKWHFIIWTSNKFWIIITSMEVMNMNIGDISQLMRYNALQSLSDVNESLPGNNSGILFSLMMDEMLQNTEASYLKNKSKNDKVKDNNNSKTANGLDSLSLQPEKMARMVQLLAEESALSEASRISSVDNGYYGGSSMTGENSYLTLMLAFMLGKMAQNQDDD